MDHPHNRQSRHRTRPARSEAVPIVRELVETTIKELKEKCQKCGHLVIFWTYSCRDSTRYVRCPDCGQKHAINTDQDTIRTVAQ